MGGFWGHSLLERTVARLGSSDETGDIAEKRRLVRPLLAPADAADAMTAYYALWYDERRVELSVRRGPAGNVDGFAAVCQTGRDLFVPLVVLRAPPDEAGELLRHTLRPGRTYLVITLPRLRGAIEDVMSFTHVQSNAIYELDPLAYRPVVNVMVQPGSTRFRYEIRTQEHVVAAAGVNWHTDRFADMYVYTEPAVQERGWGRAVAAACVRDILSARLLPLYTVGEANSASQRLATALGFADSGVREFEGQGYLRPPGQAAW